MAHAIILIAAKKQLLPESDDDNIDADGVSDTYIEDEEVRYLLS